MKDKSMINMKGTSMGSYNKPMMKGGYNKSAMEGSGLMMKCGCQIGKHMGGPKMMGGDGGSMPSVKKDNTRVKTPNNPIMILPELDGYDSKLRKIENKVDTSKYNKKIKQAMKSTLVSSLKEGAQGSGQGFVEASLAPRQAMKATYKKLKP